MKLSEYLWKRIELDSKLPDDVSPEQVQGELNLIMNGETITSDTTGDVVNEREANSVYGRNYDKLNEAYAMGRKSLFELICVNQQISDDEWEKAKQEAEEAAGE